MPGATATAFGPLDLWYDAASSPLKAVERITSFIASLERCRRFGREGAGVESLARTFGALRKRVEQLADADLLLGGGEATGAGGGRDDDGREAKGRGSAVQRRSGEREEDMQRDGVGRPRERREGERREGESGEEETSEQEAAREGGWEPEEGEGRAGEGHWGGRTEGNALSDDAPCDDAPCDDDRGLYDFVVQANAPKPAARGRCSDATAAATAPRKRGRRAREGAGPEQHPTSKHPRRTPTTTPPRGAGGGGWTIAFNAFLEEGKSRDRCVWRKFAEGIQSCSDPGASHATTTAEVSGVLDATTVADAQQFCRNFTCISTKDRQWKVSGGKTTVLNTASIDHAVLVRMMTKTPTLFKHAPVAGERSRENKRVGEIVEDLVERDGRAGSQADAFCAWLRKHGSEEGARFAAKVLCGFLTAMETMGGGAGGGA